MKGWTQTSFLIAAVLYSGTMVFQIASLFALFHFQVAPGGFGIAYQLPSHLPWILAVILLHLLALLIAVYMGVVGLRLIKGDLRGLKRASLLAFLLPPVGLIAGFLGLRYLRSVKRGV